MESQPDRTTEEIMRDYRWDRISASGAQPDDDVDSWVPQRANWLRVLERVALAIERPANRLIGTSQLNPFYHTGTIAVLLLIIVGLTGFYLYLFFKYGYDASYNDVVTRIEGPFIARTIRAIHRYASGALVITTLLHAYRTLFMERFRGPRWLAWVTGIVMTIFLWIAGVSGYWLIWDQRAQMINDSFVDALQALTPWAASYMVLLTEADLSGLSWPIFLAVFAIHVLMFLITGVFFWLHVKRLNRPKWLPPAYWVVGVAIVVLLVGVLFPAGVLPQGDLELLPGPVTIDPLFLFFLPASRSTSLSWLLWIGLALLAAALAVLPWLRRRRRTADVNRQTGSPGLPKVHIMKERCYGCTMCAVDCPYNAIQMVEREEGSIHKYIAVEDPALCVSCGICIGSCDVAAVSLGDVPPVNLWRKVATRIEDAKAKGQGSSPTIMFVCERHAAQGAKRYLGGSNAERPQIQVIALPCVGAAPPDLLSRTLDAGAGEVQIVGCPLDDCANREGNLWEEHRLVRERKPRLRTAYAQAPITAYWLPPDDFSILLEPENTASPESGAGGAATDYLDQRRMFKDLSWRNYGVAFLLLSLVMVLQVLLTDLPLTLYPDPLVMTQAIVPDIAEPIGRASYMSSILGSELLLTLEVDEQMVYSERFATASLLDATSTPFYFEHELPAGAHRLRLALSDNESRTTFVLFDEPVSLQAGTIFRYGY